MPTEQAAAAAAAPGATTDFWSKVLIFILVMAAAGLAAWLLTLVSARVFKSINKKHKGIHLVFFEKLIKVVLVAAVFVLAVSALDGGSSVWKTLLGGTAVISAVVAFAAQDVIKDVLAGLMISLHKPFELGDRIELEDGTAGVVLDITNRHVVLAGTDTLRTVVPNSKINAMMLTNYSFHRDCRSAKFVFPVGYDTDLGQAKAAILSTVVDSPLTIPGKTDKDGSPCYGEVYFVKFDSSALLLQTTVYYENTTPTEVLVDGINTSVREALAKAGVEIPYDYVNVVNVTPKE